MSEWHPIIRSRDRDYRGRDVVVVEAPCKLPRGKNIMKALPPIFVNGQRRIVHAIEYIGESGPIMPNDLIRIWLEPKPKAAKKA